MKRKGQSEIAYVATRKKAVTHDFAGLFVASHKQQLLPKTEHLRLRDLM